MEKLSLNKFKDNSLENLSNLTGGLKDGFSGETWFGDCPCNKDYMWDGIVIWESSPWGY